MSLRTKRLGAIQEEPHTLEVQGSLISASAVLWHMESLRRLTIVAKKSYVLSDDFEAYLTYRNRLFVMETPFSWIHVALLGGTPDEGLFTTIEEHLGQFGGIRRLLWPIAFARYLFMPANPPKELFARYGAVSRASGR